MYEVKYYIGLQDKDAKAQTITVFEKVFNQDRVLAVATKGNLLVVSNTEGGAINE